MSEHAIGLVLWLAVALPWYAYVLKTVPNAMELWRYESVGELADNTENARPAWFYLPQLLFLSLPWTLPWGLGIARQVVRAGNRFDAWMRQRLLGADAPPGRGIEGSADARSPLAVSPRDLEYGAAKPQAGSPADRRDAIHFFPLVWFALMVLFFSFVHLKKNQYLLPALPAQTLLIAQGFAVLLAGARRRRFAGAPGTLIVAQTIIGIVFTNAIFVVLFSSGHVKRWSIALAILALIVAVFPVWLIIRRRERAWPLAQAAAFVVMILVFGRVCFAPKEDERSAREVAGEVLELSNQPGHTLLTMRLPEEVAVYLPLDLHYDFRAKRVLMIVDDQHGVHVRERLKGAGIPVPDFSSAVPDARVKEIRQVPLKSAPGDARWKVWELTVDRSIFTLAE